ncbi:hypothetical protein BOX15_Mlig001985g2 [Macrostomum lignano]|uniref:Lariat debranching enzyme C-terminal domain-containing protein n=1 Tax=Macrostomum lignano TaxID=282301 RepID=A0A267EH51_9PLAT|nr:hypothetical protein BOX15_Mlig001985g2 [Macrostomum lignano]
MKVAVVGCLHGELDRVYATIRDLEAEGGFTVDLLLCCGDFQAARNAADLRCMAVPPKHRRMCDFWQYYNETKKAPILTIVVGGNHEASNYMQELPYGGWLAPNIWYLGYAGVVNFGGLRIGGLSGIFKQHDYALGHFEHPPYDDSSLRSVYHLRSIDVFRLRQLQAPIDVMLSHDWPRGVYRYGDTDGLLRQKSFFRDEVESNQLGSRPTEELLVRLKPKYWFSAHLHCKFAAVIQHRDDFRSVTKFLALDKVLPGRDFLQILDIDAPPGDKVLKLDAEWLTVLRSTNELMSLTRAPVMLPTRATHAKHDYSATPEALRATLEQFDGDLTVPENFERTAPTHREGQADNSASGPLIPINNPQTELLCAMCDLLNPNAGAGGGGGAAGDLLNAPSDDDDNDDDDNDVDSDVDEAQMADAATAETANQEEIAIGDLSDDSCSSSSDEDDGVGNDIEEYSPVKVSQQLAAAEAAAETATKTAGETAAETATKTAGETAAETATKTAGETAAETATKTAGETAAETATKTAGETAAETATKTAGESAAETATKTAGETAAETATKTANETAAETATKTAGETAAETTSEPAAETATKTVTTSVENVSQQEGGTTVETAVDN